MPEVTKTLELKLVDPNANKERKLRETFREYQRALRAAFNADCSTRSAVNDVVVDYELSGYAKNALKQFVPQLCDDDSDAEAVDGDHAVKFTNEGPELDHKPQNHHEWYVKIPHHEDYDLWVPASINPEHRPLMEAVYRDDAEIGECRLLPREGTWYFHVTISRHVGVRSESGERTPVGVDIGDASLVTVCHRDESGAPTEPEFFTDEASQVRHLRKTYFTMNRRLQRRQSEHIVREIGDDIWNRIDHIIHRVSRRVVERAERVDNPVLVMENLRHIREEMDYGAFMNRRLHGWAYRKLQAQIRYKAEEAGIPIARVDPRNTSTECHACGLTGSRPQQATFRCDNDECWVSEYQADLNAAINIADRYRSGESQPENDGPPDEKGPDDDSTTDGASLTGPQDTSTDAGTSNRSSSAGSRQMMDETNTS